MSKITLIRRDNIVIVHYAHKNRKFQVSTIVVIENQYWDKDHVRKNHPDFESIDKIIKMVYSRVLTASLAVNAKGHEPTAELVCQEYI